MGILAQGHEEEKAMLAEKKIEELYGILPEAPTPVAAYVPVVQAGKLLFLSGQGPIINGVQKYTGRIGLQCTQEDGYQAAKLCCVNLLAQLKRFMGDLDAVKRVVSVKVYVASDKDFFDQPKVANGMSEFLEQVFGEKGKHSRCALGTYVLPGNIPVEAEMVVEIE